MTGLVDVILL